MKRFVWAAAIAAVAAGAPSLAPAEEINLIFTTLNPEGARINTELMHPWADRINEQGKGIIHIDVRDGFALATPPSSYDRLESDVTQVTFSLHNYAAGKFPLSPVAALPLPQSAEARSVALWRLYAQGALDKEYEDLKPFCLFGISQSGLHMAKPMKSVTDWSGLKIITPTKVGSDIAQQFGGTPISLISSESYEALQRGTADGMVVGWAAFNPFRLAEVTKFHVDTPMGTSSGYIAMAKKKFDSLPPEAQKILEANGGEAFSRECGAFWDREDDRTRQAIKAAPDHTVVTLSAEDQAIYDKRMDQAIQDWAKSVPNGDETLAQYKKLLDQVAAQ